MGLKELQSLLATQQPSSSSSQAELKLYERLRGLPFWIEDKQEHKQRWKQSKFNSRNPEGQISDPSVNGQCCFNHVLGLPEKNGAAKPVFDYQWEVVSLLERVKNLIILKSVGLGISELCLRWLVWKCVYNDDWKNRQVPIIVGPNTELAIKLVKRIRRMFERHDVYFDTKETYLVINGAELECFSSHHLDSFRSLESPAAIYISEGDSFHSLKK